jgi:hypothetical protein
MVVSMEEKITLPKTEVGQRFVEWVKSSKGRLYLHDTLPKRRRTRQCNDWYFLSIKSKNGVEIQKLGKAAPRRTNPIFPPTPGLNRWWYWSISVDFNSQADSIA